MNRRTFLAAASGAFSLPSFAMQGARRPNLLYILVDQLSGLALPSLNSTARMPHTQALTKRGVIFSHAYTARVTCGPSRPSPDTGLYTHTHGVGGGVLHLNNVPSRPGALASSGYLSSHPTVYS